MQPQVTPPKPLILVTGPARSGKSEWAETLAMDSGKSVIYIATAQIDPTDLEWQTRIERHQCRRCANWTTVEIPLNLAAILQSATPATCLLIDSLGTWVANLLEQDEPQWQETLQAFLHSLSQTAADVILVAEETGWGVVPAYKTGRIFRDRLGELVRSVGTLASAVYLVTGGHALNLHHLGVPLPVSSQSTPNPSITLE